jgi:UDP-3-O-[3-hydroxymyristoyl] glucosamine N-acyltransferase
VEITVSELAALVGGQLALGADGSAKITGAAALAEAAPGDVTFFANPKYLPDLRVSKATAALVPLDFSEAVGAICIRCEKPGEAFALFLAKIAPPPVVFAPGIHPSAVVGRDVKMGEGVSIQAHVVIEDGARIGDRTVVRALCYIGHGATVGADCHLHARVTVEERCVVGNRVIIHSGAVLGADGFGYEFKGGKHAKVPQTGIVQVDDDVEIGANSCIDRARFGRTWIKAGTKIDNLVQVGHNVVVGTHNLLCGQVGISGSTRLGDYVTLAGQVGVAGHIDIGDQATVAAQGGVTKSLKGKQIYMGYPAAPAKEFREQNARIRNLERLRRRVAALEQILSAEGKSLSPEA